MLPVLKTQSKEINVNMNTSLNTSFINDSMISSSKPTAKGISGARINNIFNRSMNQENTPEKLIDLNITTEAKRSRVSNILHDLMSVTSPKQPINPTNANSNNPMLMSNNRRIRDLSINNDSLNETMKSDQKTSTPIKFNKSYNPYNTNDNTSVTSNNKAQYMNMQSTPKNDIGNFNLSFIKMSDCLIDLSRFRNIRVSKDLSTTANNVFNDSLNMSSLINDLSSTKPRLTIKNMINNTFNTTMNSSTLNTSLSRPRFQSNSPAKNLVVYPKEPISKPQNTSS